MKNPSQFIFVCLLLFPLLAGAQEHHHCGNDLLLHELQHLHPNYAEEVAIYREQIPEMAAQGTQSRTSAVVRIPVVIHVIHNGEGVGSGANLSEARIQSQIDILNEDFRRLNSDASNIPSYFEDIVDDMEIEFCLAKVDPNGLATSGITRHVFNNVSSIQFIEQTVKPNTSWDPLQYLNIWTLDMPDNSILGYAFLPTSSIVGDDQDGVVINYQRFGFVNNSNKGRTCTHEIGHYLGLQHVWGENDSSGNPIGCTSDDGISDTPNQEAPYFGCPPLNIQSCGSIDMFMNYMDYVNDNCMHSFTTGQKNVMQSVLANQRAQLIANTAATCQEPNNEDCVILATGDLSTGFENSTQTNPWVIENTNNDNRTWRFETNGTSDWGPNNGNGFAVYLWNQDGVTPGNDYLFSPCFEIIQDHSYELTFSYAAASDQSGGFEERFRVGFSQTQSSNNFQTFPEWTFDPVDNFFPDYEDVSLFFTANNSGTISLGWHVFSQPDRYAMQIDDIRVTDLGLVSSSEDVAIGESIQIFPNPVNDLLNVQISELTTSDAQLFLFDPLGRLVYSQALAEGVEQNLQIPVAQFAPGLYILQLQTAFGQQTKKVVVTR